MIRHRNFDKNGFPHLNCNGGMIGWLYADPNYNLAAIVDTSLAAGTAVTLLKTTNPGHTQSIAFTIGGSGTFDAVFEVVGIDQYNIQRTESVAVAGSSGVIHTLWAYQSLVSITPTTVTSTTGTASVQIGSQPADADCRVALPVPLTGAAELRSYAHGGGADPTEPSFTVDLRRQVVLPGSTGVGPFFLQYNLRDQTVR